ncbi:MAG: hypothetical protein R3F19_01950 [Verrucomicrobiales bacterium]
MSTDGEWCDSPAQVVTFQCMRLAQVEFGVEEVCDFEVMGQEW